MRLSPLAVGILAATVAGTGCGGGSSSTGKATTTTSATTAKTATAQDSARASVGVLPAGTPAALRGRHGGMLVPGELQGFVPAGPFALGTSPRKWVAAVAVPPQNRASEAARLRAFSFVAGLGERLGLYQGGAAEAISSVEQFRSPAAARAEIAHQLKQAAAHHEGTFAVPGIPGARGFGSTTGLNVVFSVGPYYYIVGAGAPSSNRSDLPTRAQLIAAAESLYRRVRD